MKPTYYILLILLLTFSFGNAQSEVVNTEVELTNVVSVETKKESKLIDTSELKATISRTNSDIRIYLNRERKVDNIKLLFPKINKAAKA